MVKTCARYVQIATSTYYMLKMFTCPARGRIHHDERTSGFFSSCVGVTVVMVSVQHLNIGHCLEEHVSTTRLTFCVNSLS